MRTPSQNWRPRRRYRRRLAVPLRRRVGRTRAPRRNPRGALRAGNRSPRPPRDQPRTRTNAPGTRARTRLQHSQPSPERKGPPTSSFPLHRAVHRGFEFYVPPEKWDEPRELKRLLKWAGLYNRGYRKVAKSDEPAPPRRRGQPTVGNPHGSSKQDVTGGLPGTGVPDHPGRRAPPRHRSNRGQVHQTPARNHEPPHRPTTRRTRLVSLRPNPVERLKGPLMMRRSASRHPGHRGPGRKRQRART